MENIEQIIFDDRLIDIIEQNSVLSCWFNKNKQIIEELDLIYPNCDKYLYNKNINVRTLARMSHILQHYLLKEDLELEDRIHMTLTYLVEEYKNVEKDLDEEVRELLFISSNNIRIVLNKINL